MKRKPVPKDKYERFILLFRNLATVCEIYEDAEISQYTQMLEEAVQRKIFDAEHDVSATKNKEQHDKHKFILVFKRRYLQLTDSEYLMPVTPGCLKTVGVTLQRLAEKNCTFDDYLEWLFEQYFPENDKFCPPTLKWIASTFALQQYLYAKRHLIRKRKDEAVRAKEEMNLLKRARILMREGKEAETLVETLKKYREAALNLTQLRNTIVRIEKEHGRGK